MSTEQLLNYLRGLKSEEIQRIEVIPQAGADYDADSAAGIIRITLRRQRDNGLTGDLSFSTRQSRQIEGYNPSLSLNGHAGRWTFNASGWASVVPLHVTKTAEHTEYRAGGALLDASSEMRGRDNCGGGRAGAIFDISERHSIGAEADFYIDRDRSPNRSSTDFREAERLTRNESLYDGSERVNTFSATFNYIWRIDTLGSTLKVMADYSRNNPPPRQRQFRPLDRRRHRARLDLRRPHAGALQRGGAQRRTRKAARRGVAAARRREVHLQRHAQRSALPLPPPRGVGDARRVQLRHRLYRTHHGRLRRRDAEKGALERRGGVCAANIPAPRVTAATCASVISASFPTPT